MCLHNWAKLAKASQWVQVDTYHWNASVLCSHGVLQKKGRFTLQSLSVETFIMKLAGCRVLLSLQSNIEFVSSRWTKANDALVPTRSFSSFSSHFLSSIISSFCCRSVSCMICRSFCHNHWASFLLFGSTRRNSLSYEQHVKGVSSVVTKKSN